jgi:hypothetical protein
VRRQGWGRARWANLLRLLTASPTLARFFCAAILPAVGETASRREIETAHLHRRRHRVLRPALLLVMGMFGSSCSPVSVSSPTATAQPTRELPAAVDVSRAGALAIAASPEPDFIILGNSYAFVTNVGTGIGRFDLRTGVLVDSLEVPGRSCAGLDFGFGSVWSATCSPNLARIDETTGHVTLIHLPDQVWDAEASVGAGEGAVWVTVGNETRSLVRVSPDTNAVTATFPMPAGATAVRAGLGAVWITVPLKNTLLRVDPVNGTVAAQIHVGGGSRFLALGAGAVWVMNQLDGTISRVDPVGNTVIATIDLGERIRGGDVAVGGSAVWVHGSTTLLARIDPATNTVTSRYGPQVGSGGVAANDDAVWITAHDVKTIWRLPLR